MSYIINLSLNGKHVFRTAEDSITDDEVAVTLVTLLREVLPANAGYVVSLTKWESKGTVIFVP